MNPERILFGDLAQMIGEELAKIERAYAPAPQFLPRSEADVVEALRQEAECRAEIDSAAREWIRTKKWPRFQNPQSASWLGIRLTCAMVWAATAGGCKLEIPANILERLLIEQWPLGEFLGHWIMRAQLRVADYQRGRDSAGGFAV